MRHNIRDENPWITEAQRAEDRAVANGYAQKRMPFTSLHETQRASIHDTKTVEYVRQEVGGTMTRMRYTIVPAKHAHDAKDREMAIVQNVIRSEDYRGRYNGTLAEGINPPRYKANGKYAKSLDTVVVAVMAMHVNADKVTEHLADQRSQARAMFSAKTEIAYQTAKKALLETQQKNVPSILALSEPTTLAQAHTKLAHLWENRKALSRIAKKHNNATMHTLCKRWGIVAPWDQKASEWDLILHRAWAR